MTVVKFNSERKNHSLMPGFSDVFDSIFNDSFFADRMVTRVPPANISETADHFHLALAAPGLQKDDFKLKLEKRLLTINVEKGGESTEEEKIYAKQEFNYSSFFRSFSLPESADENGVKASYREGILAIDIPKREEAKTFSRQIEIN